MLLEQIEQKLEELQRPSKRPSARRNRNNRKRNMGKIRMVPPNELDPEKSLRAEDYMDGDRKKLRQSDQGVETRDKMMGLKLKANTHHRLHRMSNKLGLKSKREVARRALLIGLAQLEGLHGI